jgi:hypothetical protein
LGSGNLSLYGPGTLIIGFLVYVVTPMVIFSGLFWSAQRLISQKYPSTAHKSGTYFKLALGIIFIIAVIIFGLNANALLNGARI